MFISWLLISLVNDVHQLEAESTVKILLLGEGLLHQVALGIKIILELVAILIILIASFGLIKKLLRFSSQISKVKVITILRLELARSLALSCLVSLGSRYCGDSSFSRLGCFGKISGNSFY